MTSEKLDVNTGPSFEYKDGMVLIPEELWAQMKANITSQNSDYRTRILLCNELLQPVYDEYLLKFDSHDTSWYTAIVEAIQVLNGKK